MSVTERESLTGEAKQRFTKRLKDVNAMFDSTKNWSSMIHSDLNQMRNDIMKRTKTNQLHIREREQKLLNNIKLQTMKQHN